ncbi:MAG: serine hydrolase domain-containing protein, partial [Natronospirillum sp.]
MAEVDHLKRALGYTAATTFTSNLSQTSMTQSDTETSNVLPVTADFLEEALRETRSKFKVPAIAVSVMNAETVYAQAIQGERAVGKPDQATLNDYFHIGSCAKSALAIMAATLVEQEKIKYDSKFFDLFPELRLRAERAYLNITLEDLLRCKAGIRAYTDPHKDPLPVYPTSIQAQRREFVNRLIEQPVTTKRDNDKYQHLYSNASYTMAAVMLERVSGLTYEALVDNVLKQELGLSPHVGWPNSIDEEQPWGHKIAKGTATALGPDHAYKIPYLLRPAGDLSLTTQDFTRYTQWQLRGLNGADEHLKSSALQHIHFGHPTFSLGMANSTMNGKRYSYADGSGGTFYARMLIAPEADFAITIMMNASVPKAVEALTLRIVKKHFNWWWKFWL